MLDRDILHDRILEVTAQEFSAKGIKAVKMDDIARRLGISKRTLYETFPNKEDLLLECIKRYEESREKYMAEFYSEERHNVIEVVMEHYKEMMRNASSFNVNFCDELRHYKKVTEYFEAKKREHHGKAIKFLRKGIEEGYFRGDVNYEIMIAVSDSVMDDLVRRHLYSMWNIGYLFHNVFFMFFRGICTPKGMKLIDTLATDTPDAKATR